MPYTKQEIMSLYSLCAEDVDKSLVAAGLPLEREIYSDEEIQSSFDVIRSYFENEQVSDYAMAAQLFSQSNGENQQSESKSQAKVKKLNQQKQLNSSEQADLNISQLLSQVSKQCGIRIYFTEVAKILDSCGLPDKDQYASEECDRFLEACAMLKQQNKSYDEVAVHFGVNRNSELKHTDLLAEVEQIIDLVVTQVSVTQAEQIRRALPQMGIAQLREIKARFYQMTAQRLREYTESGQMEREIRQAADRVIDEGNYFGLQRQIVSSSPEIKSLRGSSTNASTNE